MTSKDECRCEYGYYCRFCRLMDHRDEQIKYEKQREKEATIAELERDYKEGNLRLKRFIYVRVVIVVLVSQVIDQIYVKRWKKQER